ncbi:MAG: hypothetical protein JO113_09360 [Candidatus Eremiobacteraeota bacterium]|nr:hypothetical protein [Candidatus Eremiobacteraeota bacterium]
MRPLFLAIAAIAATTTVSLAQTPPPTVPFPESSAAASPQPTDGEQTVTLPRGVLIPIFVTKEVRVGAFGASQEEHKVKFVVDQDVVYQDSVIAKRGDLVEGHYDTQTNQTKGQFETTASVEVNLTVDDVVNFCGDTIYVGFEKTFVGGSRAGFMSFGVHAHDAVVDKGDVLEAATDRAQKHVCAEAATGPAKPLPKNIIAPDAQLTPPP